ncbi:dynein axonemal intermediate chain 4-like isoform X2 [Antedon mediterranea]|uniref:dynein axonemal intermediate chain 4-like isoform X2 n=1 Tax=Antedon mediterranea TaxID=105859 RepID=UPI003AF9442B
MSIEKSKTGNMLKVHSHSTINRSKVASMSQSRLGGGHKTQINASRATLSSSRRSNTALESNADSKIPANKSLNVQVFDDVGNDVTPQPLLIVDPNTLKQNQSKLFGSTHGAESGGGTPTDLMSQNSIYQTGTTSFAAPFRRSIFGTSITQSGRSTPESFTDVIIDSHEGPDIVTGLGDVQTRREEVAETVTEADLDKIHEITLSETNTFWLLDMNGVCVSIESDDATEVKTRNDQYKQLCLAREGNDRYMDRGMQSFNEALKNKEIQTSKVAMIDEESTACTWDMYDTYQDLENKQKDEALPGGGVSSETPPQHVESGEPQNSNKQQQTTGGSMTDAGSKTSMLTSIAESSVDLSENAKGTTLRRVTTSTVDDTVLQSESLKKNLFVMERVVTLNIFQPKQAAYRGLPIILDRETAAEEESPSNMNLTQIGPNLDRLWAFSCNLTKGRNVSCIAWNKTNHDLLAVGYGQFGFSEQKGGLVCCWSLKNPEYPERVFHCEAGVTSMDFSANNPNLLAIGLYDGTVAIYNVRSTKDEPALDSYESKAKHSSPVWELKWIEKDRGSGDEKGEMLISISTDGRVSQWQIRKGFECADLMKLKRVVTKSRKNKDGREGKSEALISRHASGLCFDFSPKDSNIYLAGTEDGLIHKCSCSYNEQYLDSYHGHTGPVNRIEWSPFLPDVFLSCSNDWSIRLWQHDHLQPVLNFFSSTKSVMDVCWSPTSASVFGCVNEGAIEIWDLDQNTLDPIIVSVPAPGVKLSCLTFAINSDCILVGDSEGQVSVFQLRCMPSVAKDQTEKLSRLIEQTLASQLSKH